MQREVVESVYGRIEGENEQWKKNNTEDAVDIENGHTLQEVASAALTRGAESRYIFFN